MSQSWIQRPPKPDIKPSWRNPVPIVDDPFGEFTSSEVVAMNRDHREEQQFWRDEHK